MWKPNFESAKYKQPKRLFHASIETTVLRVAGNVFIVRLYLHEWRCTKNATRYIAHVRDKYTTNTRDGDKHKLIQQHLLFL